MCSSRNDDVQLYSCDNFLQLIRENFKLDLSTYNASYFHEKIITHFTKKNITKKELIFVKLLSEVSLKLFQDEKAKQSPSEDLHCFEQFFKKLLSVVLTVERSLVMDILDIVKKFYIAIEKKYDKEASKLMEIFYQFAIELNNESDSNRNNCDMLTSCTYESSIFVSERYDYDEKISDSLILKRLLVIQWLLTGDLLNENYFYFDNLLVDSSLSTNDEISSLVNLHILPSYFNAFNDTCNSNILQHINDFKLKILTRIIKKRKLSILVILEEFLLSKCLHCVDNFEELIIYGLKCNDNAMEKYASYLLKCFLSLIWESEQHSKTNIKSYYYARDQWNYFFDIYESLENTQSHIIIPTLSKLQQMDVINNAFVMVLYSKLLEHESYSVKEYAIKQFLNTDLNMLNNVSVSIEFINDVFKSLVSILNDYRLLDADTKRNDDFDAKCVPKIINDIIKFMEKCIVILETTNVVEIYINEVIQIKNPTSVSFYYMCVILSHVDSFKLKQNGSKESGNKIEYSKFIGYIVQLTKMCKKVQNLFIRNACEFYLIRFVSNNIHTKKLYSVEELFLPFSNENKNNEHSKLQDIGFYLENLNLLNIPCLLKDTLDAFNLIHRNAIAKKIEVIPKEWSKLLLCLWFQDAKINELLFNKHISCILSSGLKNFSIDIEKFYSMFDKPNELLNVIIENRNTSDSDLALLYDQINNVLSANVLKYVNNIEDAKFLVYLSILLEVLSDSEPNTNFYTQLETYFKNLHHSSAVITILTNVFTFTEFKTKLDENNTTIWWKNVKNALICMIGFSTLKTIDDTLSNELFKKIIEFLISNQLIDEITLIPSRRIGRGVLSTKFYEAYLKCLSSSHVLYSDDVMRAKIFANLSQHLTACGKENIYLVFKLATTVTDTDTTSENLVILNQFLEISWKECCSLKKNTLFWISITEFIDFILYKCNKDQFSRIVPLLLNEANSIKGLSLLIFERLELLTKLESRLNVVLEELIKYGIRFVAIHRVDQRIENNTCRIVASSKDSQFYTKEAQIFLRRQISDEFLRLKTIKYFQIYCNQEQSKSWPYIYDIVKTEYEKITQQHFKGYFAHSQIHYKKNHLLQIILLFFRKFDVVDIFNWLSKDILVSNNQLSVNFLIGWIISAILLDSEKLTIKEIFDVINLNAELSVSKVKIFLIIVSQYFSMAVINADVLKYATINILPFTLVTHEVTKQTAQDVLLEFFTLAEKNQFEDYLLEFKLIIDCLKTSRLIGAAKRAQKVDELFKLKDKLDPKNDCVLEVIFIDVFKILNLQDEALSEIVLPELENLSKLLNVELKNGSSQLKYSNDFLRITAPDMTTDLCSENFGNSSSQTTNFQKKLSPWNLSENLAMRQFQTPKTEGLILVASLIERATNLGGLSRTCEIFGVSEFVINSLRHLEKQEFKNLSVSSERWLKITEVKRLELTDFLKKSKLNGYLVVGLEQTKDSISIEQFSFPNKIIILLGNERRGIPGDLLPLLDVCLEIPQKGVIRSLNVHVSGALCIWEYFKQHS